MKRRVEPVAPVSAGRADRRNVVAQTKQRWRQTKSPDALAFLAQHESIRQDRSLAIELAYEDYCIRIDNGEAVDPAVYCRQFPSMRRSLSRQIEADAFLREHAGLAPSPGMEWPQPGDALLGFRVLDLIGSGTFARAYVCAQPGVGDRQVVVKVAQGGAWEADTMGRLNHPNIMSVHSVDSDDETRLSCICMPFCGRSTLFDVIDFAFMDEEPPRSADVILQAARSRVRRGDRYHEVIPRRRIRSSGSYVTGVLVLAIQIAEALQHAHRRGVLHGDLKPSNVVLSVNGTPLLVDFNLSARSDGGIPLTGGTPPYMAPEKARLLLVGPSDDDMPDERSDIFSLGAVLYELLAGRIPFLQDAPSETAMTLGVRTLEQQSQGLTPLHDLNRAVDRVLAGFIQECVAFDPHDRPQSMDQVRATLLRQLTRSRRSYQFLRERRRLVLGAATLTGAALIGTTVYSYLGPPPRDRYYARGYEHFQNENHQAAIADFTRSLQADPDFFNAYYGRACAILHLHHENEQLADLQQAQRDLASAGSIQTDDRVNLALSVCSLKSNDFDAAVNAMESVIRKGVESAAVWNNLGYSYAKLASTQFEYPNVRNERIIKANAALHRAIELDPGLWQAHLSLAMLELERFRSDPVTFEPRAGLESIRYVVKVNVSDVSAYYCAAKLAGVIAEIDDNRDLWNECLDYLDQAQQRGCDLNIVGRRHPFTRLSGNPRFAVLLKRPAAKRAQTAAERVVLSTSFLSPARP